MCTDQAVPCRRPLQKKCARSWFPACSPACCRWQRRGLARRSRSSTPPRGARCWTALPARGHPAARALVWRARMRPEGLRGALRQRRLQWQRQRQQGKRVLVSSGGVAARRGRDSWRWRWQRGEMPLHFRCRHQWARQWRQLGPTASAAGSRGSRPAVQPRPAQLRGSLPAPPLLRRWQPTRQQMLCRQLEPVASVGGPRRAKASMQLLQQERQPSLQHRRRQGLCPCQLRWLQPGPPLASAEAGRAASRSCLQHRRQQKQSLLPRRQLASGVVGSEQHLLLGRRKQS